MNIQLLIRGNTQYQLDGKVNETLAVTFDQNINPEDYFLELKIGDQIVGLPGEIKDAKDAYKSGKEQLSSRHLHFQLNLECGAPYTYQVKRKNGEPIQVVKAYGEAQMHEHQPVNFKSSPLPNPNEIQEARLVFYGDQEVNDPVHYTHIDNTFGEVFGLGLAQPEVTVKLAKEIERFKPDYIIHGGDLMHGEHIFVEKKIKKLKHFRAHYEKDFHGTITDKFGGSKLDRDIDDHDLGENDIDSAKIAQDPLALENAVNALKEFSPVPTIELDGHRGLCYESVDGNISKFILNGRFFNSPDSVLGQAQLDWLETRLANTPPSNVKLVSCSLPPVAGKNPGEDLRKVPAEWHRLLSILAKYNVTALLTADSHNYSRSELEIPDGDDIVTIPVFVVGTGGGIPQELSKDERKQAPKSLIPFEYVDAIKGKLMSYYTAIKKPGSGIDIFGKEIGSMISKIIPTGKKKYRAYQDGKWEGKKFVSNQFGILKMKIKAQENPDTKLPEGRLFTKLWTTRSKEISEQRRFTDKASYPIQPLRRPKCN